MFLKRAGPFGQDDDRISHPPPWQKPVAQTLPGADQADEPRIARIRNQIDSLREPAGSRKEHILRPRDEIYPFRQSRHDMPPS